jgi:hypothetical protein
MPKNNKSKIIDNNNLSNDGMTSLSPNANILIGVLTVLITLWTILYAIPGIFISLFHTFLGNLILLLCTIFVGTFVNARYGFVTFIVIVVLYQISHYNYYSSSLEGFANNGTSKWSRDTISEFLNFQSIYFPNSQFNMNVIQKQASESDANHLISTGAWHWSQDTQDLYKDNVSNNELIKIDPGVALTGAMKLYNETAMKQLLSWDAPEGKFLLYGVDSGVSDEQPSFIPDSLKKHDIIRCNSDASGLEKHSYVNNVLVKTPVSNQDAPSEITGFSFVRGDCNPCGPLKDDPDFTCPFVLKTTPQEKEKEKEISKIWSTLWNL